VQSWNQCFPPAINGILKGVEGGRDFKKIKEALFGKQDFLEAQEATFEE
jgi:hypothetical protein